jgi:N-acetylneuraminate lyase
MIEMRKGLIAAPLTGYRDDGTINLDVIPPYAEMLQANGVAGVFVNGTTGEGFSLTLSERRALAERWVQAAPQGFKVMIHVGHTCQAESRALAAHAADIGAAAVGEIGPVFFRPDSVDALVDYCAETAAAAPNLPYYYYHMPSMNQVLFPMTEFLRLADEAIPNLAGIKYTHSDIDDYAHCLAFRDGKYDILFGRDEFLIQGLTVGAQGAVGSTYNIMARLYLDLAAAFHAGDRPEAERLQAISAETCKTMADTGGFGSSLKAILKTMGLDLGGMRRPQVNLTQAQLARLEQDLARIGTLEFLNEACS